MNKQKGNIPIVIALIVIAGAMFLGYNSSKNVLVTNNISNKGVSVDCGTVKFSVPANQAMPTDSEQAKCMQKAINACSPATFTSVQYLANDSSKIAYKTDFKIIKEQNGLCLTSMSVFDSSLTSPNVNYICNFSKQADILALNKKMCADQTVYEKLKNNCSDNCCRNSVDVMANGGFGPVIGLNICPKGTKAGKLSCSKNYQWCEMTSEMFNK